MSLSNVTIFKGSGGLGRTTGNEDMICGIVAHGVAIAPSLGVLGIALQEVVRLASLKDATDRGITDAYDKANGLLLHYHIKEYFRTNPEGVLWILLVTRTDAFATLVDSTLGTVNAKKLLRTAAGEIKQLAVLFNPIATYVPVITAGLDSQIAATISNAQILADQEFAEFRPINVLIEGRSFVPPAVSALNLRTLVVPAPNVAVVVGADNTPQFRANLGTLYAANVNVTRHAAIGSYLGLISRNRVNVNAGYVAIGNIQDAGNFVDLAIGSTPNNTLTAADLNTINDKGYNFFVAHSGISGAYANDAHSCAPQVSDYYCIENNRVMNKACRITRSALLPNLNSPVKIDARGRIDKTFVATLEAAANAALRNMLTGGEISAFSTYVNPNQNVLATSEVKVEIAITPTGTARQIKAFVNFQNPFKP